MEFIDTIDPFAKYKDTKYYNLVWHLLPYYVSNILSTIRFLYPLDISVKKHSNTIPLSLVCAVCAHSQRRGKNSNEK